MNMPAAARRRSLLQHRRATQLAPHAPHMEQRVLTVLVARRSMRCMLPLQCKRACWGATSQKGNIQHVTRLERQLRQCLFVVPAGPAHHDHANL